MTSLLIYTTSMFHADVGNRCHTMLSSIINSFDVNFYKAKR